jgi:hypothetical protein
MDQNLWSLVNEVAAICHFTKLMGKKKIHPGEVQPLIQAEDKTPKRKGWKSISKSSLCTKKTL